MRPPVPFEVLDLLPRPQRALASRGVAARVAKPAAEAALRRRHRRRRWPRSRQRLLPREGARSRQRRRARKGLAGRWQHGTQHDDRPLELPPRSQRALLRIVAAAVAGAFARAQLQRDVQRARRAHSRAFAGRHGCGEAPRQRDAAERHRRGCTRDEIAPDPESRLLSGCALSNHGRPARGHGAARSCMGIRARPMRAAWTSSSSAK